MKTSALIFVAALLAMPLGPAAKAQSLRQSARSAPIALGSAADPFWGRRGNMICRRWCLGDRTPCDPVQFKAADGRCEGDVRSFYGVLNCRIGDTSRPECPR